MTAEVGELGHALPDHVFVTGHAIRRLRERCPVFKRTADIDIIKLIQREISGAFRAGRVARTQPRWTIYHNRVDLQRRHSTRGKRVKGPPGTLYVWNASEDRCYGVVRDRHPVTGGMRINVRTTLTSYPEENR